MPLARIKELLAADPDRFTAAIGEIDRNLQERVEELHRHAMSKGGARPTPDPAIAHLVTASTDASSPVWTASSRSPATQGGRVNGGPAATALVARRRNGGGHDPVSHRGVSGLWETKPAVWIETPRSGADQPEPRPLVGRRLSFLSGVPRPQSGPGPARFGYAPAMWPMRSSTPSSEHSSSTCSTSSVPTHRRSSSRGRPAISPRTSSSASTTISLDPGSSFLVRGAALLSDEEERSRRGTSHGLSRRSDRDRRQASSASGGCAGSRTSTSSSSTTRTYAEPTVVVLERTSRRWTRPCGATSVMGAGSSPGDCAVQDSRCSGRGPPTPFEHGEGNARPFLRRTAVRTCRASCSRCCTVGSSGAARVASVCRWP